MRTPQPRAAKQDAPWTEADIAIVRNRWNNDGASAGVIGREIGRSRNSICGLINRRRAEFVDRSQLAPLLRIDPRPGSDRPRRPKAPAAPPWAPEEIETAVGMWAEWWKIREIAAALGRSYDSVNKFINQNRERFPNRHQPRREGGVMAARPDAAALARRMQQALPPEVEAAPSPFHAVTFLDVGDRQCRWPLWSRDENPGATGLCCGARINPGLVYCGFHRRKSAPREDAADRGGMAP